MEKFTGGRGVRPNPKALRNSGWKPPLIQGKYHKLVFVLMARPEFKDASTRQVIEAALEAIATPEELAEIED